MNKFVLLGAAALASTAVPASAQLLGGASGGVTGAVSGALNGTLGGGVGGVGNLGGTLNSVGNVGGTLGSVGNLSGPASVTNSVSGLVSGSGTASGSHSVNAGNGSANGNVWRSFRWRRYQVRLQFLTIASSHARASPPRYPSK